MSFLGTCYSRVTDALPPEFAARLDSLRPSIRNPWGGPLNGQERRREIVRDLARAIGFNRVIETGAFRGATTEFLLAVFGPPIHAVEIDPRFFAYTRIRLRYAEGVFIELGDSREFLRSLSIRPDVDGESAFFYLDAHWEADIPLVEELRIIGATWKRALVMVDDFQVPGDSGYVHDDYGPGRRFSEEMLPVEDLQGWALTYPSAPSAAETGARRGCCVLASPGMPGLRVPSLRPATVL